MSKEVGGRVLAVRTSAGLNQRDFAAQLGTSSGGISQIESGKTMPGGDFLLRLHENFDVDVTWLLTGQRNPSLPPPPAPALSADEASLLADYRASHPVVQRSTRAALREAAAFSGGEVAVPRTGRRKYAT